MKKVTLSIPLRDTEPVEVKGYEFTLPNGHQVVVHKSINGYGWSVSTKVKGLLMVYGKKTKKEAVQASIEISEKHVDGHYWNKLKEVN
ncbi:hypothetical protein [Metabacillus arenae]|uniref:Uncharacterized protein n=1 Tax=Metabacillus arenae TaxID=2771434 RepID=A0A926RVR5_9BACI|nr:hypothetical protein [Metabacillus arenae]MBD1379171.1 hypothetical protein [Metabacillus arenae]